jgi:hypothetical protein
MTFNRNWITVPPYHEIPLQKEEINLKLLDVKLFNEMEAIYLVLEREAMLLEATSKLNFL